MFGGLMEGLRELANPWEGTCPEAERRTGPEPSPHGPALTPHGRAVDVHAGEPVFFPCDSDLVAGHEAAAHLREERHKLRLAELAKKVEFGKTCSIDEEGLVHGAMSTPRMPGDSEFADLQKVFHRKRHLRERANRKALKKPADMCLDVEGHMHGEAMPGAEKLYTGTKVSVDGEGILHEPPRRMNTRADRLKLFHKKLLARTRAQGKQATKELAVIDSEGHIRGSKVVQRKAVVELGAVAAGA